MRLARWTTAVGMVLLAAVLSVPAWCANADNRSSAVPGTVNYVEGQASIADEALNAKSVGSTTLQTGQILQTDNGKTEILLTPGVYLRLGNNSSVEMVSAGLTNTELALKQGQAMLEVDEIHSQNDIRIRQAGATTRIEKTGLYDFDAVNQQVRVFDGKADVLAGDQKVTVKKGHELALNTGGKLKAQGFDKKEVAQNDDLYRWSSLRSDYLSEANVETARVYVADGWYGPGWFGAGWYWNPWFSAFTFVPGDGFLYSPFGWGFYSPLVVERVPIVVGGFPHRFDGTRARPAIGNGFHQNAVRSFGNGARVGGFHGGPAMHAAPVMHPPAMRPAPGFSGFRGAPVMVRR